MRGRGERGSPICPTLIALESGMETVTTVVCLHLCHCGCACVLQGHIVQSNRAWWPIQLLNRVSATALSVSVGS